VEVVDQPRVDPAIVGPGAELGAPARGGVDVHEGLIIDGDDHQVVAALHRAPGEPGLAGELLHPVVVGVALAVPDGEDVELPPRGAEAGGEEGDRHHDVPGAAEAQGDEVQGLLHGAAG